MFEGSQGKQPPCNGKECNRSCQCNCCAATSNILVTTADKNNLGAMDFEEARVVTKVATAMIEEVN